MVVGRVHDDGDRPAGQDARSARSGLRSAIVFATIATTAVVAPCSTAVPRPRTTHSTIGASPHVAEITEVLEDREAGADGEALHRRIDDEADPAPRIRNATNSAFAASSVTGAT